MDECKAVGINDLGVNTRECMSYFHIDEELTGSWIIINQAVRGHGFMCGGQILFIRCSNGFL